MGSTRSGSALLVMDAQESIAARVPGSDMALRRMAAAVGRAREAGVPVIHVTIAFRDGHPEVSEHNRVLSGTRRRAGLLASDPGTRVHPALAPAPGEVTVVKRRVSSFCGTDLELILRAGAVSSLVLAGFTTSGVVLATALAAVDLDFEITVLGDACADHDVRVHDLLLSGVLGRRGDVVPVDDWAVG